MKRRRLITYLIYSPFLLYSTNSRALFWVGLRVVRALVSMIKLTKTVSRVNKAKTLSSGISLSSLSVARTTPSNIQDMREHINARWNGEKKYSIKENREHVKTCTQCGSVYRKLTQNTTLEFSTNDRENYITLYERAKHVIGENHHHKAFRLLKESAQMAIDEGESEYLLYHLESNDKNGVFWKLSHGHNGWNSIIRALKNNDYTILNIHVH